MSPGGSITLDMGATTRLGSVLDETSTFDYEPEEIKRQGSISTAFLRRRMACSLSPFC